MNKIDEYLGNIYKDFDKSDSEVQQLKKEMRSHLDDKISELQAEGKSEEESIRIAIDNFGEENNVSDELKQVIQKKNIAFSLLTKFAVLSFIIASIFLIASWVAEKSTIANWEKTKPITADVVVKESILEPLAKEQNTNETTKAYLTQILDDFNEKNNNGLYYVKATRDNNLVVFEYSKPVPKEMILNGVESSVYDSSGLNIQYKTTDFEKVRQMLSWESRMDIFRADNLLHNKLEKVSFQLFFSFWILILIYFIQKTLFERVPNKIYIILLIVETFLVFTPLTFADHQDFMVIAIVIFTAINLLYQGRNSSRKNNGASNFKYPLA